MLVIGESHSIMGEKGNRTHCIDRDDLALLNAISMRETLKIADLAVKIKQRGNYPYPPYQRDSQWRHPQGNVLGESDG